MVFQWLSENLQLSAIIVQKLIFTLTAFIGLVAARRIVRRLVLRKQNDPKDRYYWSNFIRNVYYILLSVVVGAIWIDQFGSLATFLGLLSAGLAIALQDPIVNFAGWIFILGRRPFEVGHRVQIGDHLGDVIDIRIFQFTIHEINNWVDADQPTGRIIHIPNGVVFRQPQANFNQAFQFIWNEIGVLVTFESNWQKAKQILNDIIVGHGEKFSEEAEKELLDASKQFFLEDTSIEPSVFTDVKDAGVMLTMRFMCKHNQRRASEHKIWEEVLLAFAACDDIDFAYPTQRIYYNAKEGKPGARA